MLNIWFLAYLLVSQP